jgi:hypothetical protein
MKFASVLILSLFATALAHAGNYANDGTAMFTCSDKGTLNVVQKDDNTVEVNLVYFDKPASPAKAFSSAGRAYEEGSAILDAGGKIIGTAKNYGGKTEILEFAGQNTPVICQRVR